MREEQRTWLSVGEVSGLLGISVRTLHHWEDIGLLPRADRSYSNYRRYYDADLELIQKIVIYRGTGMKLSDIKLALAADSSNLTHLLRQRRRLTREKERIEAMLRAVDKLVENEMTEPKLSWEEIGQIMGEANFANYQREAEESYGDTEDWLVSQARTSSWDQSQWEEVKSVFAEVEQKLAEAVRAGESPESEHAAQLVLEHRQALSHFFPVTPAKHYLISRAYINDPRFQRYYDRQAPGLSAWLSQAIASQVASTGLDLRKVEWN